jgi:hypothetical protein
MKAWELKKLVDAIVEVAPEATVKTRCDKKRVMPKMLNGVTLRVLNDPNSHIATAYLELVESR